MLATVFVNVLYQVQDIPLFLVFQEFYHEWILEYINSFFV